MSVGVALYLSGEGRKQIEGAWKRVLAAGFQSPARVPGQRPHVSLVNGECELPLAQHLGSELVVPLARVDSFACELHPMAFLLGGRRVAYYPLVESTALRKIHESVYNMAVAAGVHVRETCAPGAWVPHVSLSGDVPEHREAEFRAALDLEDSPASVLLAEAGVIYWRQATGLIKVATFALGNGDA